MVSGLSVAFSHLVGQILKYWALPQVGCAGLLVLGFSLFNLVHLAATVVFRTHTGGALLVDLVVVLVGSWGFRRLLVRSGKGCNCADASRRGWNKSSVANVFALILTVSLLTTLWTREALQSVLEAKQTGVFRVWVDFLFQAAEIGYQIHYPSFNEQTIYLSGVPQSLYHRASYTHAALFAWISGDALTGVATYYWLPTGMVMMGLGAYCFGAVLGGPVGGWIAALALFLLPDASMYGLQNGYFAFYWLITVAPGAGYAIGLCLVALAVFFGGLLGRSALTSNLQNSLLGALVIALASSAFRIHIAIPVIMLLGFAAAVTVPLSGKVGRPVFLLMLISLAVCLGLVLENIAHAPHFISGANDGTHYVEAVHAAIPTAYEGKYALWTAELRTPLIRYLFGYFLLLAAQHGLVLPLLAFFIWKMPSGGQRKWAGIVAGGLLVIHGLIIFGLPTPANGDITEWSHRSFPMIHAILVVLLVATAMQWWAAANGRSFLSSQWPTTSWAVGGLVFFLALLTPLHFGHNLQYGTLKDGPTACATKISKDTFAVTDYIRRHAQAGDRVFATDGDPDAVVTALTGLQAYIARAPFFERLGGSLKSLAQSRWAERQQLVQASSYEELAAFGSRSGVRWLLFNHEEVAAFAPTLRARAVFSQGSTVLFDLKN